MEQLSTVIEVEDKDKDSTTTNTVDNAIKLEETTSSTSSTSSTSQSSEEQNDNVLKPAESLSIASKSEIKSFKVKIYERMDKVGLNYENIKSKSYELFNKYCLKNIMTLYQWLCSGITRTYQPDILGYVIMMLMMYTISDTFKFMSLLFCVGTAYIGAVDYYNEQVKPSNDNQKTSVIGLVSLCSILIFDSVLSQLNQWIPYFGIFLFTKIVMYIFFSEFFVKFISNYKKPISTKQDGNSNGNGNGNGNIEPLYQMYQLSQNYNIDNFLQYLFTDIVICNNVICEKICIKYNISILTTIMQPIKFIKTFDFTSTMQYIKTIKNYNIIGKSDYSDDLHIK